MVRISQGSLVKANVCLLGSPAIEHTTEGHYGFSIAENLALLHELH